MYNLVSRITDGLGELKKLLETHIHNQGLAAIEKCGDAALNVSSSHLRQGTLTMINTMLLICDAIAAGPGAGWKYNVVSFTMAVRPTWVLLVFFLFGSSPHSSVRLLFCCGLPGLRDCPVG